VILIAGARSGSIRAAAAAAYVSAIWLACAATLLGCQTRFEGQSPSTKEVQVSSLRLAFGEGFDGDVVVADVGGRQVKSDHPISTRHDVEPPLAWSVDVPLDRPVVTVKVSIPAKNASQAIDIDVRQSPQLDVSFAGGKLLLRGSEMRPSIG
jgi:hypothetical protein